MVVSVMFRELFLILLNISMIAGFAEAAPDFSFNLTEVGGFTTREPHGAEFYKDYLFIADGDSLLVYNTSDPEEPRRITKFTGFNLPRDVNGLSVSGERLYVAAGSGWIYVLNISSPEDPKIMYQVNYYNSANDVAVAGEYMYIADANTGLLVFNKSRSRKPELVGTFYVLRSNVSGVLQGWGGISVEVSGRYAFLSAPKGEGFYIIDVFDPERPKQIFHSLGKDVFDISISGEDVYLARADGTPEFNLLDISNPYSPEITGDFFIPGFEERSAIAVHPSGEYIYAAAGENWHIFRTQDAVPPTITISKPGDGEITVNRSISISGTAFDRSGISEVLVNDKFAGTETWNQIVTLQEGENTITVTAKDKNGNTVTEKIQVIYRPVIISTPTATPTITEAGPLEAEEDMDNLVLYIIVSAVLIVLAVLVYRVYKR